MIQLPPEILRHIGPVQNPIRPGHIGNADVWLLGDFVLKLGNTADRLAEQEAEFRVVAALSDQTPLVPKALAQVVEGGIGYFLYSRVAGENLVEAIQGASEAERHRLVAEFGRALRLMHGWAPALPRPADWLSEALIRAEANLSDEPIGPEGPFQGADPRTLFASLQRWRPTVSNETVFGHGDYCLPNVMLKNGRLSGIIDLSRGAYMDRRIDLAAGVWTIRYNFGEGDYAQSFLDGYGYIEPPERLHWFEALWHLLP